MVNSHLVKVGSYFLYLSLWGFSSFSDSLFHWGTLPAVKISGWNRFAAAADSSLSSCRLCCRESSSRSYLLSIFPTKWRPRAPHLLSGTLMIPSVPFMNLLDHAGPRKEPRDLPLQVSFQFDEDLLWCTQLLCMIVQWHLCLPHTSGCIHYWPL